MKETVLRCDLCKKPRKLAIDTLTLSNGRTAIATLDVCGPHEREAKRFFRRRKDIGRPPGQPETRHGEMWESRKKAVLAGLEAAKEPITTPEFSKVVKLRRNSLGDTLRLLLAEGKVKKINNGPHTKWRAA